MDQAYFDEDNIQDKQISDADLSDDEDTEAAVTKKRIAPGLVLEGERKEQKPMIKMPKGFNSAKKCLLAQIEGYFKEMKEEFIRIKDEATRTKKQQPSIVV